MSIFFFQAEDGIRYLVRSRGLGDVYKRQLHERGTTYQHILDEIRIELAKEYVASTGLSVDQIAGRIGFAEATTFRRAFKKWTGMNIKEFKRRRSDP